jgi:hypothetical protein
MGGPAISGLDTGKDCGGADIGQMCFTEDTSEANIVLTFLTSLLKSFLSPHIYPPINKYNYKNRI